MYSPSPCRPCRSKSKSPDWILAAIELLAPALIWSCPVSCSKYVVTPSVLPTVESLVALESYSVPCGLPNIEESNQDDLASELVVHTGLSGVESIKL